MKEIITTENAPAAVGTYSTAYKCGNMVFLSGQLGLDPVSGELPASFEAQCRQAFRNVFAIVKAAGGTPADIVRQTVYLTDLDNFGVVNKVMSEMRSDFRPSERRLDRSGSDCRSRLRLLTGECLPGRSSRQEPVDHIADFRF